MPTAGMKDTTDGDGQIRDVGNDEKQGRMQGVDKMDTKAN